MALRSDEVSRPGHDQATFRRLVLEHPGAVMVLALDDADRVLVLEQYRHPAGRRFVELPAGLRDLPDEDPLVTARRELLEEAELEAAEWEHLLTTHPSPGISSERLEVFVARRLTRGDRGDFEPAHEEADMVCRWVHLDHLVSAVLERRLSNGPLALAVLAYAFRARTVGHVEGAWT